MSSSGTSRSGKESGSSGSGFSTASLGSWSSLSSQLTSYLPSVSDVVSYAQSLKTPSKTMAPTMNHTVTFARFDTYRSGGISHDYLILGTRSGFQVYLIDSTSSMIAKSSSSENNSPKSRKRNRSMRVVSPNSPIAHTPTHSPSLSPRTLGGGSSQMTTTSTLTATTSTSTRLANSPFLGPVSPVLSSASPPLSSEKHRAEKKMRKLKRNSVKLTDSLDLIKVAPKIGFQISGRIECATMLCQPNVSELPHFGSSLTEGSSDHTMLSSVSSGARSSDESMVALTTQSGPMIAAVTPGASGEPFGRSCLRFYSLMEQRYICNKQFRGRIVDVASSSKALVILLESELHILNPATLDLIYKPFCAPLRLRPLSEDLSPSVESVSPCALGVRWLAFVDQSRQDRCLQRSTVLSSDDIPVSEITDELSKQRHFGWNPKVMQRRRLRKRVLRRGQHIDGALDWAAAVSSAATPKSDEDDGEEQAIIEEERRIVAEMGASVATDMTSTLVTATSARINHLATAVGTSVFEWSELGRQTAHSYLRKSKRELRKQFEYQRKSFELSTGRCTIDSLGGHSDDSSKRNPSSEMDTTDEDWNSARASGLGGPSERSPQASADRSGGGCSSDDDDETGSLTSIAEGMRELLVGNSHSRKRRPIVTVVDVVKGDRIVSFETPHDSSVTLLQFDHSGTLLATADKSGVFIHVFQVVSLPNRVASQICPSDNPGHSAVFARHLYRLFRGWRPASVRDLCFSLDSKWLTVSSSRGTVHVFAIHREGGPIAAIPNRVPSLDAGALDSGSSSSPTRRSHGTELHSTNQAWLSALHTGVDSSSVLDCQSVVRRKHDMFEQSGEFTSGSPSITCYFRVSSPRLLSLVQTPVSLLVYRMHTSVSSSASKSASPRKAAHSDDGCSPTSDESTSPDSSVLPTRPVAKPATGESIDSPIAVTLAVKSELSPRKHLAQSQSSESSDCSSVESTRLSAEMDRINEVSSKRLFEISGHKPYAYWHSILYPSSSPESSESPFCEAISDDAFRLDDFSLVDEATEHGDRVVESSEQGRSAVQNSAETSKRWLSNYEPLTCSTSGVIPLWRNPQFQFYSRREGDSDSDRFSFLECEPPSLIQARRVQMKDSSPTMRGYRASTVVSRPPIVRVSDDIAAAIGDAMEEDEPRPRQSSSLDARMAGPSAVIVPDPNFGHFDLHSPVASTPFSPPSVLRLITDESTSSVRVTPESTLGSGKPSTL